MNESEDGCRQNCCSLNSSRRRVELGGATGSCPNMTKVFFRDLNFVALFEPSAAVQVGSSIHHNGDEFLNDRGGSGPGVINS